MGIRGWFRGKRKPAKPVRPAVPERSRRVLKSAGEERTQKLGIMRGQGLGSGEEPRRIPSEQEKIFLNFTDNHTQKMVKVLLHVYLAQMVEEESFISSDSGKQFKIISFRKRGLELLKKSNLYGLHEAYCELCRKYSGESERNKPAIERFISAYSLFWKTAAENHLNPDFAKLHSATRELCKSTIAITSEDRGETPLISIQRISSSLALLKKIQEEHAKNTPK